MLKYKIIKGEKKMKKRVLALVCAGMMLLAGCGNNGSEIASSFDFKGYPIEDAPEMTYWVGINNNMSMIVGNAGETDWAKGLVERTGVKVTYEHPTAGQEATELGARIGSGDLPDMMEYGWNSFNGGAQISLDQGIIIPLNDYIDEYAPNFKKYLEENPEIDKMIKTDDGTYYAFPFIRGDERLLISTGPVVRRDWIEKAGLEMPKTVADLEEVLKAFKADGVKKPLSVTAGNIPAFMGNFSTDENFYYNDKKIVYGPMTDEYEFALETLNRWYKEGLLDENYVSIDDATLKSQVLNNVTGMSYTSGGGGLGTWLDTKEAEGVEFDMVGFSFTASKDGESNQYHRVEWNYPGYGSVAISTKCENPAYAVAYLDYGYGEEGSKYYNFGEEGVSYEMKDGKAIFTDLINKNPNGWTQASAMTNYLRSSTSGPFVQHKDYIDQFYARPNQQDSLNAWLADMDISRGNKLPPYSLTAEEAERYAEIMTDVQSKVSTERDMFITGKRPLSEYDEFIEEIKALDIEEAIEIVKTACDRYNKR